MKTCSDSIAWAAMRQPSMRRCGTRATTSRSLNAPGSDSSAFTTRYDGRPLLRSMSDALRPIGKPAPPRPRRFASWSSAMRSSGVIARAFSTPREPPIARYSSSFVRSRSPAPASRASRAGTKLLDDPRHVLGLHRMALTVVYGDHRRVSATVEALDHAQRHLPVLGRLARLDAELGLERADDLLRTDERTGEVRADRDLVLADGGEMEHVVERRHRAAVRGRVVERVGDLGKRFLREPAVLLLRHPQRGEHCRTPVG